MTRRDREFAYFFKLTRPGDVGGRIPDWMAEACDA